jgi:hypothetical protein
LSSSSPLLNESSSRSNQRTEEPSMPIKSPKVEKGKTSAALAGKRGPSLPHERDESVEKTDVAPRKIMQQAKADIDSGKVATDRSEAADAAYRKQKEP